MTAPTERTRTFQFERDTFAYAHELVWQYRFDPVTGAMTTFHSNPPPAYYHRCFVMARSARQFFYHARFEPDLPVVEPDTYRRLIRQIVSHNPRGASAPPEERIVFPGYDGLRAFSQVHEPLLKAACGGAWQSYFVRGHWRMVFPVWRRHQEREACRLERSLREGRVPVVHLFRFPHITINHGIVLFSATSLERTIRFDAYDPNIPDRPVPLTFDRDRFTFGWPASHYWAGGPVNVVETFRNAIY